MSRASRLVEAFETLVTNGTIVSYVAMGEARWLILLHDGKNLYHNNAEADAFIQGAKAEAARI